MKHDLDPISLVLMLSPMAGDPRLEGFVRFLQRHRHRAYSGQAAFVAALALRYVDIPSAMSRTQTLVRLWSRLFENGLLESMDQFEPDLHFGLGLEGRISGLTASAAQAAIYVYSAACRDQNEWLITAPSHLKQRVRPYLLPPIQDPGRLRRHAPARHLLHPNEERIQHDAEWLMERLHQLGAIAWERLRFLGQIDAAMRAGRKSVDASLEDQQFRFLLADDGTARLGGTDTDEPWFIELVRERAITGRIPKRCANAWARANGLPSSYFHSRVAGVLRTGAEAANPYCSRRVDQALRFSVAPLYRAALFGNLAVQCCLDTGPRLRELMQFAVDASQLRPLAMAEGYAFKVIAKGSREVEYLVGEETIRAAVEVASYLRELGGLSADASLPMVPFSARRLQDRHLPSARYIFQFGGRHLDAFTLTSCLRFILHGLYRREGKALDIRCHLLRHGFAKALLAAGLPLSYLSGRLQHADPRMSFHYGRPTQRQALAAALAATRSMPDPGGLS